MVCACVLYVCRKRTVHPVDEDRTSACEVYCIHLLTPTLFRRCIFLDIVCQVVLIQTHFRCDLQVCSCESSTLHAHTFSALSMHPARVHTSARNAKTSTRVFTARTSQASYTCIYSTHLSSITHVYSQHLLVKHHDSVSAARTYQASRTCIHSTHSSSITYMHSYIHAYSHTNCKHTLSMRITRSWKVQWGLVAHPCSHTAASTHTAHNMPPTSTLSWFPRAAHMKVLYMHNHTLAAAKL